MKIFSKIALIFTMVLHASYVLGNNLTGPLSFYLEIQERNFNKSVDFCGKSNPDVSMAYKKYLDDFAKGTQLGLEEVSKELDPKEMLMSEKDKREMLVMQDKQGSILRKQVQANPAQGCPYILNIFSSSSQEAAKQQILSMYSNYLSARKKYCSQSPKPENCT